MGEFEEFDHSGDVGIEVRAESMEDLFATAARALMHLMATGPVEARLTRRVAVESDCFEGLLVDWLAEILSLSSACGEIYGEVEVEKMGAHFVEGLLKGEPVDEDKHELRFEVKAVTYHRLSLTPEARGYRASVIFDL